MREQRRPSNPKALLVRMPLSVIFFIATAQASFVSQQLVSGRRSQRFCHCSEVTAVVSAHSRSLQPRPSTVLPESLPLPLLKTRNGAVRALVGPLHDSLIDDHFISASTAVSPDAHFAPVLNVPALGSFLFIAGLYGWLVNRLSQISQTVDQRTNALEQLKKLKAQQLAGLATNDQVNEAVETFRFYYTRVEQLRNVLPNTDLIRISPPPTSVGTESHRQREENQAAARQYLGYGAENVKSNERSTDPTQPVVVAPSENDSE
jgi:hypothetical protein